MPGSLDPGNGLDFAAELTQVHTARVVTPSLPPSAVWCCRVRLAGVGGCGCLHRCQRRGRWVRTASLRNGGGYDWTGGLARACLIQRRLYSTAMTVSVQVDLGTLGRVGTALADPTRRRVLVQLIDGPGYPAEMAEVFGTTRANLSNHLTCLRECGLVTATAEGRRVRYELADQRLADGLRILAALDLPGSCR